MAQGSVPELDAGGVITADALSTEWGIELSDTNYVLTVILHEDPKQPLSPASAAVVIVYSLLRRTGLPTNAATGGLCFLKQPILSALATAANRGPMAGLLNLLEGRWLTFRGLTYDCELLTTVEPTKIPTLPAYYFGMPIEALLRRILSTIQNLRSIEESDQSAEPS